MANYELLLLRTSIGIVLLWFEILKYFEGMSPAEGIAVKTIEVLTFHLISEKIILYGLAIWEVAIGIGLYFNTPCCQKSYKHFDVFLVICLK